MSLSTIHGRDVDLWVERGTDSGEYVLGACATDMSVQRTADEKITTTIDSGREDEYTRSGSTNAVIQFDGAGTLDVLGKWQYEDWLQNIGELVNIRVDYNNYYGDRLRFEMKVVVLEVSDQSNVNDFMTFSITMKRSGAETITKTIEGGILDLNLDYILDTNGVIIR